MITKEIKSKIVEDYGINPQDTGSSRVQVAILTQEITLLTQHCQTHPKDFGSRRGLLQKVCNRRKHLSYLARTNQEQYRDLIQKLGLRK